MYTISQAAARSGVSVPLLRAWERRYGIVSPQRTSAGYRLYDETALERLRTMRRLVDEGWTPATAAGAILSGDPVGRVDAVVAADAITLPTGARSGPGEPERLVASFVDAAAALDADGLEEALDRMFAAGTFEAVADGLLLPALVAVGNGWATGRLSVAAEHAASHAMLRRLAAAYQAAGRPAPRAGSILVGMPPTVRHELGALAFSTAARRAGLPILYLGSDVPVDDWVATAQRTGARAAVVGAVTAADVRPAIEVGAALRAALPRLVLAFGGHASAGAAEGLQTRGRLEDSNYAAAGDALLVLPDRLGEAVDALDHALRRASPG